MNKYERKLKSWKIRDDGNNEWGEVDYRGIIGKFMDCDGDFTEWSVKKDGCFSIEGNIYDVNDVYHEDVAIRMIEELIFILSGDADAIHKGN